MPTSTTLRPGLFVAAMIGVCLGACGETQSTPPKQTMNSTKPVHANPVNAGQVFENMMQSTRELSRRQPWNRDTHQLNPYLILEVKPEDWTGTEEGRFAHSIKIPNPVPEDSGYRPGMTQQEYFQHLCKNEAGEFIFKTADNVESIAQLRVRPFYKGSDGAHLHYIEDPYGYFASEVEDPAFQFVNPKFHLYRRLELPVAGHPTYGPAARLNRHQTMYATIPSSAKFVRYFGGEDGLWQSLQAEYVERPESRYGFTWRGIKRPHDREMGIGGGELIVLDLKTGEVMGVRRGYAVWNRGWTGRLCPRYGYSGGQDKTTYFTSWFLVKVVRPPGWKEFLAVEEKARRIVGDPTEKRF